MLGFIILFYITFFLVEIPNGQYKGQKLIKLVSIKTPETTRRMMAIIPDI